MIVFEHKLLYKMKGQVPEGYYTMPIGKAEVRREGTRRHHRRLGDHGAPRRSRPRRRWRPRASRPRSIDLRSIRPLDRETIVASVCKTGKLLCVYEGVKTLGRRRRDQRARRRERGLRLSRRADPAARRRRGADPLQPGPGEGGGAAGARHRGRGPQARAPGGLRCRSRSSCRRSTWTWRPASSPPGTSPRARP